jgi:hypothetical protein
VSLLSFNRGCLVPGLQFFKHAQGQNEPTFPESSHVPNSQASDVARDVMRFLGGRQSGRLGVYIRVHNRGNDRDRGLLPRTLDNWGVDHVDQFVHR